MTFLIIDDVWGKTSIDPNHFPTLEAFHRVDRGDRRESASDINEKAFSAYRGDTLLLTYASNTLWRPGLVIGGILPPNAPGKALGIKAVSSQIR